MIVNIPGLPAEGTQFAGEEPAAILGLEDDSSVKADAPVAYDFFVQVVTGELVVRGSMSISLDLRCSRCSEFFSTTVADSSFLRAYELSGGVESVDLTGDIREAILLCLPHFAVCKPDCKGLCPVCGKNLNKGDCSCTPPAWGGNWEALDKLEL